MAHHRRCLDWSRRNFHFFFFRIVTQRKPFSKIWWDLSLTSWAPTLNVTEFWSLPTVIMMVASGTVHRLEDVQVHYVTLCIQFHEIFINALDAYTDAFDPIFIVSSLISHLVDEWMLSKNFGTAACLHNHRQHHSIHEIHFMLGQNHKNGAQTIHEFRVHRFRLLLVIANLTTRHECAHSSQLVLATAVAYCMLQPPWMDDVSIAHSFWWVFNMARESFWWLHALRSTHIYGFQLHHNHHHCRRRISVRFSICAARAV